MVTVTLEEAKDRLGELLLEVAGGQDVVICQHGVPLGQLMSPPVVQTTKRMRQPGRFAGKIQITEDFDAPLDDFADYS